MKEYNGTIISKLPDDSEVDINEVLMIVKNTKNTWQVGRKYDEVVRDTLQGKKSELVFERAINNYSKMRYIAYDKIRKDLYQKHAPFDGLLVPNEVTNQVLNRNVDLINNEIVYGGDSGQISVELRNKLEDDRIFTIEIKSSSLKDKDYIGIDRYEERKEEDYVTIINNIKHWDFFVYPHYIRTSEKIKNFYEYSEFVQNTTDQVYKNMGNELFLKNLMKIEYENASDIYTRLYLDKIKSEIYIPGYILKEDFFCQPVINHMPGDKSGRALYYMHSISDGKTFIQIDNDIRLKEYNRLQNYKKLLAGSSKSCPKCKNALRICKSTRNKDYFYRCFDCEKNYALYSLD